AGAADVRGEAELLEGPDHVPAEVDLRRSPSEAGGARVRVVIAVPVLALEALEEAEPDEVLTRVLVLLQAALHVGDRVHEALRVERPHQAQRPDPEERRPAEPRNEREPAEERDGEDADLPALPPVVVGRVEIRR